MKVRRIKKVLLYNEGMDETVDIEEIAEYVRKKLGQVPPVEVRGSPFSFPPEKSADYATYARRLASLKIQDVSRELMPDLEPLYGEVQYEERRILGKTRAFGVLYDGFRLQRLFSELMPQAERPLSFVHIFFTNRLFATWEADKRYHARTSVYGFPSIVSTAGLVEAPAKPREYYRLKQQYEMAGRDLTELNEKFSERCIDYGDERLTRVMKGYTMQAVFYALTGDAFCEDKGCKLYNAHWQEELIFAQLESRYEFCECHSRVLDSLYKSEG